ncbi:MAG: hypothetical protein IJT44_02665 [Clostridia bacterium]|nr:hypothetical protein [Clostridia bacterium]
MQIKQFMDRFGRKATLRQPDGWQSTPFCCFLQPLRYKNKMYLYGVNTQIGHNAQGHYLYIGPPEHDLTALGDNVQLRIGDESYRIDRAEKVYCGKDPYYIWAIVRTVVEESEEPA